VRGCPFCKRPVADDASTCPHPGCGRPIAQSSRTAQRPPPPPQRPRPPAQPLPRLPADPRSESVAKPTRPTPPTVRAASQTATENKTDVMAAPVMAGFRWRALLGCGGLLGLVVALLLVAWWAGLVGIKLDQPQTELGTVRNLDMTPPGTVGSALLPQPTLSRDTAPAKSTGVSPAVKAHLSPDGDRPTTPQSEAAKPVSGIYVWRTRPDRATWLSSRGGTPESEHAAEFGLEWLVRHQSADGSWSSSCLAPAGSNPHARCDPRAACPGAGKRVEMAHTGLAVLALQAGGHYDTNGNSYSENVAKGLRWMIAHQGEDGALIGSLNADKRLFPDYMYEHGIATFALAEAYALAVASGRPPGEGYAKAAEAAVRFIQQQQHADGGWRYTADKTLPSDTSISSWQVLALWTAREAGIQVDEACLAKAVAFYQRCETGQDGRTAYLAGRGVGTDATTGAGMCVHLFLQRQPDSPLVQAAAPYLASFAEKTWGGTESRPKYHDFYLWHHCSLPLARAHGPAWDRWNRPVRETLIELQQTEGCTRGSWDPETSVYGRGAGGAGRIYTTALAILTLEVYYRFAAE
jgi:hypothetical protein